MATRTERTVYSRLIHRGQRMLIKHLREAKHARIGHEDVSSAASRRRGHQTQLQHLRGEAGEGGRPEEGGLRASSGGCARLIYDKSSELSSHAAFGAFRCEVTAPNISPARRVSRLDLLSRDQRLGHSKVQPEELRTACRRSA